MEAYIDDKLDEYLNQFLELGSNIVNHPILRILNPNEGKVAKIVNELNKAKQTVKQRSEEFIESYNQLTIKEQNLLNLIDKAKKEIEDIKKQTVVKENELRTKEADFKEKKQILENLLNKYVSVCQIDTKIELEDNLLIATIILVPTHPDYKVRLKINRTDYKVIDVDASSILTPRQEEKLMEIFGNFDNISGLICSLKEIILMKLSNVNNSEVYSISSSNSSLKI